MSSLSPRNLSQIRAQNAQLGDCLSDIVASHNNVAQQVNAEPVGQTSAPQPHTALKVTGGAGYFAAHITDSALGYRGKEHFLEVSEDPNFSAGKVHTIHLGASTSYYGQLGSKTLHFRSYSAHPTSGPSAPVYATNISGAGGTAPSIVGSGDGSGWGKTPYLNSSTPPKR